MRIQIRVYYKAPQSTMENTNSIFTLLSLHFRSLGDFEDDCYVNEEPKIQASNVVVRFHVMITISMNLAATNSSAKLSRGL